MAIVRLLVALSIGVVLAPAPTFAEKKDIDLTDDKNMPSLLTGSAGSPAFIRLADSIYDRIGLLSYGLDRHVFSRAYKGYRYIQNKGLLRKSDLLTICDYSQSSNNKRLYVIDLKQGRLLYNTYVSHGRNSGQECASTFSNLENSNKSSLGFLVTAETYSGKAGYSMRLDGLERGINDRVRNRDIVLHGSLFVNERVMDMRGVIGKSLGCPAVPLAVHKKIIDVIKGGSCFFVNHPDEWYARSSGILNANIDFLLNPAVINTELSNVKAEKIQEAPPASQVAQTTTSLQP